MLSRYGFARRRLDAHVEEQQLHRASSRFGRKVNKFVIVTDNYYCGRLGNALFTGLGTGQCLVQHCHLPLPLCRLLASVRVARGLDQGGRGVAASRDCRAVFKVRNADLGLTFGRVVDAGAALFALVGSLFIGRSAARGLSNILQPSPTQTFHAGQIGRGHGATLRIGGKIVRPAQCQQSHPYGWQLYK
jgi:hypothetical protein